MNTIKQSSLVLLNKNISEKKNITIKSLKNGKPIAQRLNGTHIQSFIDLKDIVQTLVD